jgi:hypothetical protein
MPAGRRRVVARKKGVVWAKVPFMATIAVPQKKKGRIRNRGGSDRERGEKAMASRRVSGQC